MKPNYTDKQIQDILKTAIVLIDTREQENSHIIEWLDKKNIEHRKQKLDFGDYTLLLPQNYDFGIMFDKTIDFAIERKHNLTEISGNLTQGRSAFENELIRGQGKMLVIIEDGSWGDIITHSYRTEYNEKSFIASLITFYHRYDIPFTYCEKAHTGEIIYKYLIYRLKEDLK